MKYQTDSQSSAILKPEFFFLKVFPKSYVAVFSISDKRNIPLLFAV